MRRLAPSQGVFVARWSVGRAMALLTCADLSAVLALLCSRSPEPARRDVRRFSRPHSREPRRYRGAWPHQARAAPDRTAGRADSHRRAARPREAVNLCANNYLGLADHPTSSPRREAPSTASASAWRRCASSAARRPAPRSSSRRSPSYLGKDDAILFAACFDANGGVFEPLLDDQDAIISDASTTPRSSTACGSARPSAFATPIRT